MPLFPYEASDSVGAITTGEIEAVTREAAAESLARRGLIPITLGTHGESKRGRLGSIALFEHITPMDRIFLVRNLSASIKAGLNIIEALDILIADASKATLRKILLKIKSNMENGQALSASFKAFPQAFPPVFVGMMRAGEASGKLAETLDQLSDHLAREYNLARKIKSAMTYPIVLMIGSALVVVILLVFVLPKLAGSFLQSGAELPGITKFFLGLSHVLTWSPLLDIIVAALLVVGSTFMRRTEQGKRAFTMIMFKTPVVRELAKKVALVRFTRTLGSLVGSGTSILESLELAGASVGNILYRRAIEAGRMQVTNGVPFSRTMESNPKLFPRFLVSLVAVGEKTGTMEHILKTFANFYDEEVEGALKDLTNLIEPVLLLVMGFIVGGIALSVILPIYKLVGKFL